MEKIDSLNSPRKQKTNIKKLRLGLKNKISRINRFDIELQQKITFGGELILELDENKCGFGWVEL